MAKLKSVCPFNNLHRHLDTLITNQIPQQKQYMFLNPINSLLYLLQQCQNKRDIQQLHANIISSGFNAHSILATKVINLYTKCGALENAYKLFNQMEIEKRSLVLWTTMISGFTKHGNPIKSLNLFSELHGFSPKDCLDEFVCTAVISAIGDIKSLLHCQMIHSYVLKMGFHSDLFISTSLIDMYSKCGDIEFSREVFDEMLDKKNIAIWNSMITSFANNGLCIEGLDCFRNMLHVGMNPNFVTILSLLNACGQVGDIVKGKLVHCFVVKFGFEGGMFVQNSLVTMYGKCNEIDSAVRQFQGISKRDLVSWNSMMSVYVQNRNAEEALACFHQMESSMIKPDLSAVMNMILACGELGDVGIATWAYKHVVNKGYIEDVAVANSIVSMFVKCGCLDAARDVFYQITKKDIVSWTTAMDIAIKKEYKEEAFSLFCQMLWSGIRPSSISMITLLSAFSSLRDLDKGKAMHATIMKSGFNMKCNVGTALIDMYSRCKNLEFAGKAFEEIDLQFRDAKCWTSMISACIQNEQSMKSLFFFDQMQRNNTKPDIVAMLNILSACTSLGALQQGRLVHSYIIKHGIGMEDDDISLKNTLLAMYAKCGSIEAAHLVFDKMKIKDIISWNTIISAYGHHGLCQNSISLFHEMQKEKINPDSITFVSLLSACSHGGLVEQGWDLFESMKRDYGILPGLKHYSCIVDLLGRAGLIIEAIDFVQKMPISPNSSIWGTLLGACRIHGRTDVCTFIADKLLETQPDDPGFYVLLANTYAAADMWDDVSFVRGLMKRQGLRKTPGWSVIEVNNMTHTFHVGDRSHPQSDQIYSLLEKLFCQIKSEGYLQNMNPLPEDTEALSLDIC